MHILIADNDINYRATLSKQLTDLGHSVIEALDENNVLQICKHKCPDLLFIDLKVSGSSGLELVHKVRQLGGSGLSSNIVVLSAHEYVDADLRQGLVVGVDDCWLKPINHFNLLYKLASVTRNLEVKQDILSMATNFTVASHALENINKLDTMTGLYDVNTFYRNLEQQWFKASKENYHLGLILFNLDYFRSYNELYGTELGDKLIKQIATILQDSVAPPIEGIVARTAGETFAMLLWKQELDSLVAIANKLVNTVAGLAVSHKGSACSDVLTISAGVAIHEHKMRDFLELIEAADFALYTAKHTGRNRVYAARDG